MPRYFTRSRALWVGDDDAWPVEAAGHIPTVAEHVAMDTGLLDQHGAPIMRAPNPIGFGKDDEW